jgi:hypothetical protein
MHVIAHHRITDGDAFRARAAEPCPDRPAHWRLIAAAPTRDGTACFSLWWADSADALQRVLAAALGPAGSVACHEVDDDDALGLPTADATRVVVVHPAAGRAAGRGSNAPCRSVGPALGSPAQSGREP